MQVENQQFMQVLEKQHKYKKDMDKLIITKIPIKSWLKAVNPSKFYNKKENSIGNKFQTPAVRG